MRVLPLLAGAGAVLGALPATAHVTLDPPAAPAGASPSSAAAWPSRCATRTGGRWRRRCPASPARITREGGPLPDERYEGFVLMPQAPNEPGGLLVLPVTQSCEGGRADAWVERPGPGQSPHDLARPAPALRPTSR